MIDTADESAQCSEDTTRDIVRTTVWTCVMHVTSPVFLTASFIILNQRQLKFSWFRQFSFGVRTIACETAFETRNNHSILCNKFVIGFDVFLGYCACFQIIRCPSNHLHTMPTITGAYVPALVSLYKQRGTNHCKVVCVSLSY